MHSQWDGYDFANLKTNLMVMNFCDFEILPVADHIVWVRKQPSGRERNVCTKNQPQDTFLL
jgi:hypothetical protein